jgi:hypothetical protein
MRLESTERRRRVYRIHVQGDIHGNKGRRAHVQARPEAVEVLTSIEVANIFQMESFGQLRLQELIELQKK